MKYLSQRWIELVQNFTYEIFVQETLALTYEMGHSHIKINVTYEIFMSHIELKQFTCGMLFSYAKLNVKFLSKMSNWYSIKTITCETPKRWKTVETEIKKSLTFRAEAVRQSGKSMLVDCRSLFGVLALHQLVWRCSISLKQQTSKRIFSTELLWSDRKDAIKQQLWQNRLTCIWWYHSTDMIQQAMSYFCAI